jgi:long-chain fatty acid transport protein
MGRVPGISVGASWRSSYDLNFDDGALHVTAPLELSGVLHDTPANATIPIPTIVSMGAGVRPIPRLFVQGQVDFTNWSKFSTLAVNAPQNPMMNVTVPQDWSNGWTLRTGAEYEFDSWSLRTGIGYDWNPVPTATLGPIIPDSNRWLVSGGASLNLPENLVGEVAVMGVIFNSRTSDVTAFPASFSNWAVLTGLSLRYRSNTSYGR